MTTTKRTLRLADDGTALVITQETAAGRQVDAYFLTQLPTTAGHRAFRVTKHDTTTYSVLLNGSPATDTCTCPGGHYRGRCKHTQALRRLVEMGRL